LKESAIQNNTIRIRGARVHNLKNVSLEIPHEQLTVVTGVSGSGKSSLAFDTIYAEGQRRYVESLSAYARQFLERMEKPDVDEIDGIAPPVAIRQKNTTRNPRSTVATSTELHDFLRLLWARAGRTYCPNGHGQVERDTVDHVAAKLLALPAGSRWYALFPVAQEKSAEALRDRLFDLRKKGFNRLYQGGQVYEFSTPESLLDVDFSKPVSVLVDRIAISETFASEWSTRWKFAIAKPAKRCSSPRAAVNRCSSTKSLRARSAARNSSSPSRACSASTILSAPANAARDSATPSITTWTW
jgi:excinuclease ABC subunit A